MGESNNMEDGELDFTPTIVNRNSSILVVIGNSGELIKLDNNRDKIGLTTKPFPAPILSGVIFEDIWVGVWVDRELGDARMAALPLDGVWENGVGRDVLRTLHADLDSDLSPKTAIWQKILSSEPMAFGKIGENIIFATMNKGIYMIDKNGQELWREHYPKWNDLDIVEDRNPLISIIGTESGMVIWSASGAVMELDKERKMKRSEIIKLKDKIFDVRFSEEGGWFIMLHGKSIAIMDDIGNEPYIIKTPGPVMDSYFENGEWRWTGWRHDGVIKLKSGPAGRNWKMTMEEKNSFSTMPRENIGIHIFDNKVMTNDGRWEDYSSS